MAELDHTQEGFAYRDGEEIQLYDPNDREALERVLLQKCLSFSFMLLDVTACVDTSVPSASVKVTLYGVTLAECTLSPDNPGCKIGGSVDGSRPKSTSP